MSFTVSAHIFQSYSGGMGCSCERREPHDKLQVVSGKQTNKQTKCDFTWFKASESKGSQLFFLIITLYKRHNDFGILAHEF